MRRFPRREAEVAELARQMIAGLKANAADFPSPPITPDELQMGVGAYEEAHLETVEARAAYASAVDRKAEALASLKHKMTAVLRYAEHVVSNDNTKLQSIGWKRRRDPSPMKRPGQVKQLVVVREGPGWVSLRWKKPKDGGPVAFYHVRVRHSGKTEWRDDALSFETATIAEGQERGVELEYCVVAINKAGEGLESNTVTALL